MSNLLKAYILLLLLAPSAIMAAAGPLDYSKEAVVIQSMATKVTFSDTGARQWEQTLSVRVQSEAAVRQFGVLAFSYASDNEQMKVDYVRVKKPGGDTVETPESSILDVATQVAAIAPTYIDLRQKQVPVKGLGVGDVLEYSVHSTQTKAETPGQFWYTQYFVDEGVVLNQSLEIRVPSGKYVQAFSPRLLPETRDEAGQRVYLWTHSQLELSKPPDPKKPAADTEPLAVQLTSFKSWEEVGNWWAALAAPQSTVTPALQQKANELTAGLSSDLDKEKALYKYASMNFRYISISLGAGRYRPHSAAEVYANQYGDCKDKHTLFAALLKAAGIDAWPALIGAGIKFQPGVPSPAQFNHVITVIPKDGKYVWLDTTAEVAPFGLLSQTIRDEQALVIPSTGKPVLIKTPADPPSRADDALNVKATLDAEGTLNGHLDFQMTGENALAMRGGFRQLAPTQWQVLAQQFSYGIGYAGEVTAVEVDNIEDTDKPLHLSYGYSRKSYSDWEEHQITPPLPPMGFGPGDEADKPKEAFWAGDPGITTYHATLQLPKGFALEAPPDQSLTAPFAEYSSHYTLHDGTLISERKMTVKKAKVQPDEWEAYKTFNKGVRTEQAKFLVLSQTTGPQSASGSDDNIEAAGLVERAFQSIRAQNVDQAQDLLHQAEQINPKQARLWLVRSVIEARSQNIDQAIADCRKELLYHPDEIFAYQQLSAILVHADRRDEAIDAWRSLLKLYPANETGGLQAAELLKDSKRFDEIPQILEAPIAAAPNNYRLQAIRVDALLHIGKKEQAIAEANKIAGATSQPDVLNNLAYSFSDADTQLGLAAELAAKAITQIELDTAKIDLAALQAKDLGHANTLSAFWDTLGWIYYKQNELAQAEKYFHAAWQIDQAPDAAYHLGLVYDKQGKHQEAIHMWRLAAASGPGSEEAATKLRNASLPLAERPAAGVPASGEELGRLRTFAVPDLTEKKGSAEFFLIASKQGIEDVRFISGSDAFKNAGPSIRAAKYDFALPDAGPEKIVRRGILMCLQYTKPACNFTLLAPSPATAVAMTPGEVQPPTLISKTEPEYSKEAQAAKVEGTVLLAIVVDETGTPTNVTVEKALGYGLDEKARDCVSTWKFKPGTSNGKPVSTPAKVEVNFRLLPDGASDPTSK